VDTKGENMNGVESIGSVSSYGPPRVNNAAEGQATTQENEKSAGMDGALTLSNEFLRQTMAEMGFVDIKADGVDRMKVFLQRGCGTPDEQGLGLDSLAAAATAAHVGAQIAGDANLASRIMGQVDPERVAALLK
jgi:hypothetical protein